MTTHHKKPHSQMKFIPLAALLLLAVSGAITCLGGERLALTAEEQDWLATKPVIRVANEMDWPPFDFSRNGKAMGYSIDLVQLIAARVGFEIEFVNDAKWPELMEAFKTGGIDIMPAIYVSPEREEFASFTASYFSQPSVLVTRKDEREIDTLADLDGRRVAAIRGFMVSEVLAEKCPGIERILVDNVLAGMNAVSTGDADAFIDSIGVISHVTRENYIPNVRLVTHVPFEELANPDLHMAVRKEDAILRGLLQKGIDAITPDEWEKLRGDWLHLPDHSPTPKQDGQDTGVRSGPIPWWLIPVGLTVIVFLGILSKIIDRPVTEQEMARMNQARRFWLSVSFANLKISAKILLILVLVSAGSVIFFGYVDYREARQSLRQESFNKLTAVREMKAQQVEDYFEMIASQVVTFSESRTVIDATRELGMAFTALEKDANGDHGSTIPADPELITYYQHEFLPRLQTNTETDMTAESSLGLIPRAARSRHLQEQFIAESPYPTGEKHKLTEMGDDSPYSRAHRFYHPILRKYLEEFGFYDIFLIDAKTGHIVYSVFKEIDYATSLLTGPYKDTNLALAFRAGRNADRGDFFRLVDFEPYVPSYNAPAAFIASPIFDGNEKTGVLVFQMPIDRINDIMTSHHAWETVGLGVTGETYLVGSDYLMRNQSRFLHEDRDNYLQMVRDMGLELNTVRQITMLNTSIGLQPVITEGTQAALAGRKSVQIFRDYRGVPVLSAYRPLTIQGVRWVIMSEIDEAEAMAPAERLRGNTIKLLALFLAGILAISFAFAKTMTRPIKVLTAKANALAEGDLGVPIQIRGGDEIAQLGRSFDVMRKALADLIGGLEQKVEERTTELASKTDMLETTIESLTHPFYVINADDYTIALMNQAAAAMGPGDAHTCHALTHHRDTPCDNETNQCPLEIIKRSKKPVVVEHTHFDSEGNVHYMEVHGYPIFDDKGKVVQMIEYSLDITIRKQAEQALARANKRMGQELSVGHEIQMSMLPLVFPAFPDRDEINVFAALSPAREVGGDFYDFFFLDEDHFCFCIGDVSGKGVPAALFMAVTKTLIKSRASTDFSPASIMTHVNDELSEDNESCMFVTLYLAILDLQTGHVLAANAGHNPPLRKNRDGTVEWLRDRHGPVVGAMPGIAYGQSELRLQRGDSILLYTDGVTEADDGTGTLFGESRLETNVAAAQTPTPESMVEGVKQVVYDFEGADQADDITLLALGYEGRPDHEAGQSMGITLTNDLSELPKVIDAFESRAETWQLPQPVVAPLCMVLDELLNNVISYAYPDDGEHSIEVTVERLDDAVVLTIADDGVPFNPFTVEAPDTGTEAEHRDIGGLGIHLVQELTDDASYRRRVNRNVVKITKRMPLTPTE